MVGDARIYAANGNPRKRRPDSKPALFFFLPPSPLLSFRQPPKKKSANREMHSTYPAGTFPKLMRDEITAPSPRGSGRQSRRLLERHWRRCPFPPRPPCQLLFQPFLPLLFFFPLFLSFFFFFFVLVVLRLSSSHPMLLLYTRGRERDSFQLVWSLRASVYPLQKAALNLRRNLLRPGSFKEEFSSYWRRIFLLALTR